MRTVLVSLRSNLARRKDVAGPNGTDQAVAKQGEATDLGPSLLRPRPSPDRPGRPLDAPFLLVFWMKFKRTPGTSLPTAAISFALNVSTNPSLVRRQKRDRVCRDHCLGRLQNRLGIEHQLMHLLAQRERARCRYQTPARPDEQRVPRRLPKPRQRSTHGGGAETQALGGALDAALREEDIKRGQQIEIR